MPQGLTTIFNTHGRNDNKSFLDKPFTAEDRLSPVCSINDHIPCTPWVIFSLVIKNRWQNKVKNHNAMNKLLKTVCFPVCDSVQVPPFPEFKWNHCGSETTESFIQESHDFELLPHQSRTFRSPKSDYNYFQVFYIVFIWINLRNISSHYL